MLSASAALLTEPLCTAGSQAAQSGRVVAPELPSLFLSGMSLRGTARGFSSGGAARCTAQPCPNMGRSLSSADPWHRIHTYMDFHTWLSKIKAFRAFFLPVPCLSDCISPQLSFPRFFCGLEVFGFFSPLQESNRESIWNRQSSWRGSAASQ